MRFEEMNEDMISVKEVAPYQGCWFIQKSVNVDVDQHLSQRARARCIMLQFREHLSQFVVDLLGIGVILINVQRAFDCAEAVL